MNTHWHPDFYSGANGCFIQLFAALGHVNDLFPKAVMFGTRCLFQHKRAAGSELSNGSSSLGRSRGGSCCDTCAENMEVTTCGSKRSFQDFLWNTSTSFGCGSNARRYCRSNARRAFSTVLPIPTIPFSRLCPSKTMNVPRRRLNCGRRTALGLRGWRVQ
jgi:hypothetical protein